MQGRWGEISRIELISGEDEVLLEILPKKTGKITYFLCEYKSKDPVSTLFFDHDNVLIHEEEPQIFNGKFGPGVIIH